MKRLLISILLIATMLPLPGVIPRGHPPLAANEQPMLQTGPPELSRYSITDLSTLGGDSSYAEGINDNGQIVGQSELDSSVLHAVLWSNGIMTDLGTLGGQQSLALDINNAGQVIGWSDISSSEPAGLWPNGGEDRRAFLWENNVMQILSTFGGNSSAYGINNSGQVVGDAETAGGFSHAFLWDGVVQDLGTLGGTESSAYDINDAGQVVGEAEHQPFTCCHAFLWQNNIMQDLGTLGGDASQAWAINEVSQVVGASLNSNGAPHAFLWGNDLMQDLGTLGGIHSYAFDINDAGQVVGVSGTDTYENHAFLWESNQMKDLNDLIPIDSGWVLNWANAINKRGQIVGYGILDGQTHAFLLTPNLPVLIVPGIAGTYAANANDDLNWLTHRGVPPNELQIDPLGNVYNDLIQTLENLGYEQGRDLFVVNYDWRLLPGPLDGQFDGHVSGLDAQTLADDQFNYAVDYLGWSLRQAADAYRAETGEELEKVNIISHSTGGLVARTYIQSDAYGGVYDAANDYHLPTIDQFIMVGVPNRGASKAWNPLHDNWIADTAYRVVLSKIVNRAYKKVLRGETIFGPDYNINRASITVNGTPDPVLFIEKYVPTIRTLLATYEFIDFGLGVVDLNDDPLQRNGLLLDLNDGLDLNPTLDPNPFADHTNTTVICGSSAETARQVVERTGTAEDNVLLPFTDFAANDAEVEDVWYADLRLPRSGDGTVPLVSCRNQFQEDGRVDLLQFSTGDNTSGNVGHTELMSNLDVQKAILDILALEYEDAEISTGTGHDVSNAISVISDPVGMILVDGEGRRLGYSQTSGVLIEIPGSVWFGSYDGSGYVFGEFTEPLHLELTGLGDDYYVMVAVERFGRPAGGVISSGYLAEGQVSTVPITINHFIFLPITIR